MGARIAARRGVLAALVATSCCVPDASPAGPSPTPWIFDPAATPAYAIRELSYLVLGLTGAIFLLVTGLLTYALLRYRRRSTDPDREPPQFYGSTQIELAWTLVPVLIVVVLFLTTARYIFAAERFAPGSTAVHVTVVGHQWWWEIRYPELGVVTANELHVPVSDPPGAAPTLLTLESADVIHSFWVPQLAGKLDLIPNKRNRLWIDPHVAGTYVGQCAEFCGAQHAGMLLRVVAHPRAEFDAWVAAQRAPAASIATTAARAGREVFESQACISCHTVRGTRANGVFGPDLTHLMSRETLGAGVARNDADRLRAWVEDPAALKRGAHMPPMKLPPEEMDGLVAYLVTLE
jgi:cytochrome c oxidase subunit 2